MKFYLKKLSTGRVYLSQIAPKDSEEVLQEIEAEKWITARERTRVAGIEVFRHHYGHGFYDD